MDPMLGQTLGHYRIDSQAREGGMGVVYRAFDTHLDRWVAIKILRADAITSPERKRRFLQEAKAMLNHCPEGSGATSAASGAARR